MTQIEKSELTKNKILAAAECEFSEKGIWGARIDAIAASAGVNKRMIYEHYESKEGLYKVVNEYLDSITLEDLVQRQKDHLCNDYII